MSIQFSLAANYDMDLIPELGKFPVHEVYGKLPSDFIGGGRPSYMGTPLDKNLLKSYCEELHNTGIEFNYLLNSSCLGNKEWGKRWQKKFMSMMTGLQEMGIKRVTVSIPYLMEIIKKRFPEFHVRVGIFAQIDTPSRARFWEDLGADVITLESYSINRDFERLSSIRKTVSCELQLIANHVCLPNCAMQPYHQTGFAHSSDGSRRLFIDKCILDCARKRLDEPALFLKSAWIRPEDLKKYHEMGYNSFKLLERGLPSSELLKRVKAYSAGKFDGDLGELLLSYGFKEGPKKEWLWGLRHFFRPGQVSPAALFPIVSLAKQQGMMFAQDLSPVKIDNRSIPSDFLEKVSSCSGIMNGCGECHYCDDLAQTVVEVDETFRKKSLQMFDEVKEKLTTGCLWNV
ncbi:peptidase U32 [Candidatus Riflebacteria bacterium]